MPGCDREHEEKDVVSLLSEMFGLNNILLKVNSYYMIYKYSKTCVKWPLSKRRKFCFQDQFSHNAGQK